MSRDESSDDVYPGIASEVESIFDVTQFCEVRITVRLPDSYPEPRKYQYSQLMLPDDVRIQDVEHTMPPLIKRVAKGLITSLRFR